MGVSKYLDVRILKSTKTIPITSDEDSKLEFIDSDKTLPITSTITIKGAIVSVVMNTFDVFYVCPDCKTTIEPDDRMAVCNICSNLF